MVVEAGAGPDVHTSGAVEAEPDADRRLRRRTDAAHRARRARLVAAQHAEERVVVVAVADADADAAGLPAYDAAVREQALVRPVDVVDRHIDEVRARGQRLVPERPQLLGQALALLDHRA